MKRNRLFWQFLLLNVLGAIKVMDAAGMPLDVASYEEVKRAEIQGILVIDVREPKELEGGRIPGSINIPLNDVEQALQLPPDKFLVQYGSPKPKIDDSIIFSCRSGRRSAIAYHTASKLGYTHLKNFDGGWLLYQEKEQLKE